ncbi:hypothetical protein HJ057_23805 [Vibrio parahaemolyticus]|uniref:hypothetical protein n=1 Tax=Vibrio parahaemolyticus TaxID=670 RepID=UPI0015BE51ED|nr:hypothetical protein [Vibrio parahaemolyticus]MBE4327815.1 hypothetical protein [Vibrio parahaemolyticus]QLE27476.1 hypothetical protein FDP11_18490 [Vibrio parahaemolyticus]HCE1882579.1 hypothetical protein [Vibrio parahaemolyticus]HCE3647859.1 hypothetical protein [Vibrio parahaemolyticus]HCE4537723.1 hypothetical protein [Vibrio parahaemolyticus]
MKKDNIIVWVLGVSTLVVLGLQIVLSNSTTTKTESALFGVLQFLLSLGFAWVMAKQSTQEEFESKQRKFAIAAFRRIKEIEAQTEHLIQRLNRAIDGPEEKFCHELDIAKTLALSISDTTRSSKLDWADVIGDQIEVIEKIENIQGKSASLSEMNESTKEEQLNIQELKKSLSTELKLSIESNKKSPAKILSEQLEKDGVVRLRGFVEPYWSSVRSIDELSLGEDVEIRIADEEGRIATLAAYDKRGKFVGSFLNSLGTDSYAEFTKNICDALGSSKFSGKVVGINKNGSTLKNGKKQRLRFEVEVSKVKPIDTEWTAA